MLYWSQNNFTAARIWFKKALQTANSALGNFHPVTRGLRKNYKRLLSSQSSSSRRVSAQYAKSRDLGDSQFRIFGRQLVIFSHSMRTVGIVGGLGPESTIDYYRAIIASYRTRTKEGYPKIIINSLDPDKVIAMLDAGRLDDLSEYLSAAVEQLVRAGADFGCIAANTPHLVFDKVQSHSPIPLLSIVCAAAQCAKARGLKKVGLFGTGFTMRAKFYPEEFERVSISLVTPREPEREYIHGKYIGELLKNQFLPETRDGILRVARRMQAEDEVEAIVLAGTELPLLLRESGSEIEFLDTTVIHVEAIVDQLLK